MRVRPLTAEAMRAVEFSCGVLLTTMDFPCRTLADPLEPHKVPTDTHKRHIRLLLAFTRRARARRRDGSTIFFPIFIPWKPQQDSHSTVTHRFLTGVRTQPHATQPGRVVRGMWRCACVSAAPTGRGQSVKALCVCVCVCACVCWCVCACAREQLDRPPEGGVAYGGWRGVGGGGGVTEPP